ncbi:MAG: YlxR family protein [Clostridia bacterium]|nr:YlxR family protein [Clostridia bacterium]
MATKKSVPMRMCIACRQMQPKKEMYRVVKSADGEICVDPTGKMAGRGAYICGADECQKKLADKKLLHKAFSTEVSQEVYRGIEEEVLGEK